MRKLFVLALMLLTVVAFGANPVVVDDGGTGDFTTIQAAINSWCPGGANAGETAPFVINILAGSGPYDEALCLDDIDSTTRGDIVGDLTIQSSDGSLIQVALQAGYQDDGLCILQNEHDVTIKDLVLYPSLNNPLIDEIVRVDENDTNSTFNTITFENCIITEIDTAGSPLVATMAEAATATPTDTVGTNRTGSYPYNFMWWGDAGEAQNLVMTNCAVFCNPYSYMVRLCSDGQDGENCTLTNCIARGGGYCNIRASSNYASTFIFTGTDQTQGWQNCMYVTDPLAGHGYYLSSGVTGAHAQVEKSVIKTEDRGVSGSGTFDMDIADCIIVCTAPGIVDGPANASTWTNLTIDSPGGIYFGVTGTGSITARNCIFSGTGSTGFTGAVPSGGIDVDYCAYVESGADAITDRGSIQTDGSNIVTADPGYASRNPESEYFMDVSNIADYQGAGTSGSDLVGGANLFVVTAVRQNWSVYE